MSSTTNTVPAKLAAALVAAQRAAKAVYLDSKNEFHRYRYASAEAIILEARAALNAAGLFLMTTLITITHRELPRVVVKKDNETHKKDEVIVRVVYLLGHESGESISLDREWPAFEEPGRPIDKAVAASITNGLAYTLRDLLLLPRDDDAADDMNSRDDRDHGSSQRPTKPNQATKPANTQDHAPPSEPSKPERTVEYDAGQAPAERPAVDLNAAGEAYKWMLEEMAKGHLEHMQDTISKSPCSDDTKKLLRLVLKAWEVNTAEEMQNLGGELQRSGMPKPWQDEAKDQLRVAWKALKDKLPKAA
jgi:hypothetical protein